MTRADGIDHLDSDAEMNWSMTVRVRVCERKGGTHRCERDGRGYDEGEGVAWLLAYLAALCLQNRQTAPPT